MLKKMRWHFIGAAMAAFTAVVLTLLCFVNVWNYHSVTAQQDEALVRLMEMEDKQTPFSPGRGAPPFDDWLHFSPEVQYSLRFFAVHYDADGAVLRVNQDYIASISESDAEAFANAVLESGKTHGYKSGYRYLVHTAQDETAVLFLNSEREIQTMRSLLWITLAIAAVCLAVVFGLVVLFSRRAITPYLKNMEAQKQFITNAGHELKTPIAIISANTEVIEMCSGESEWTKSIHHQTERLTSLVTQLLTLAKMDEGGGQLELKEWNASETIIDAVQSFEAPAVTKQITLQTDIAKELRMEGDAARIHQLVSLLVDNAVKYTPEGGTIRVRWWKNGKKAELAVENTCDNLPEGDLNRLFDRFYRADASRARESGGYGIGLSVAAAIVQAHKGKITAERTKDGICFRAVFPAK